VTLIRQLLTPLASAVLGAVLIAVLRSSAPLRRRLLTRPFRRGTRAITSPEDRNAFTVAGQDVEAALGRATRAADPIVSFATASPSETLEGIASVGQGLQEAAKPGSTSLASRLLYPDETQVVRHVVADAAAALAQLDVLRPAVPGRSFATFAARQSGAPVLVDAADSRARVASDVVVWHRRRYRGRRGARPTYEEAHPDNSCLAGHQVERPGDYDGRCLDLEAVELVEDPIHGRLTFLFTTGETCYAATEEGQESWGCKHLDPEAGRHVDVQWRRGRRVGGRLAPLTSYVTLISADRQLVLCERSSRVRSGLGVLSASAGGICEPGGRFDQLDVDETGMPDPLVSAVREVREELGIELPRTALRPIAVFVANSIGFRDGEAEAQLVPTVLSLARIDLSFDEIERRSYTDADAALGAFELETLRPVSMTDADAVAQYAEDHAADLDQHGFLSLVYSAMVAWGIGETLTAFGSRFDTTPWCEREVMGFPRNWADPDALSEDR
jgi:8-oxo-dGTP pyrophosphatase MutT (NUDIX family)